jgi:hypothetical protein
VRKFLVAAALFAAACQGDRGAISVRWHVVDLTSGNSWDPRSVGQADGACSIGDADLDAPPYSWSILSVQLVLADPVDGTMRDCSDCNFNCNQREATTSFDLDPGTFAISLTAVPGPNTQVVTPAPAIRTIKIGEVVNLDVIELGVRPLPLANPDAGVAADLAP